MDVAENFRERLPRNLIVGPRLVWKCSSALSGPSTKRTLTFVFCSIWAQIRDACTVIHRLCSRVQIYGRGSSQPNIQSERATFLVA
jgi:hypothetical protein